MSLPDDDLHTTVPLHVVFGEAADLARFHKTYYATQKHPGGILLRPGLDTVVNAERGLTEKTGEEIVSLLGAAQEAQARYLLAVAPRDAAPTDRARFVLDEVASTLDYLFDDGVEDERDAQLASVAAAHADDPDSTDALAAELDDYAALADTYRSEMDGLGGFDAALIDEARTLAAALRARPSTRAPLSEAARTALALRNRLVTLLSNRMGAVRSAARFVFRRQPAIVREATSLYQRRRRAAARKVAQKKATVQTAPVTPPAAAPTTTPAAASPLKTPS